MELSIQASVSAFPDKATSMSTTVRMQDNRLTVILQLTWLAALPLSHLFSSTVPAGWQHLQTGLAMTFAQFAHGKTSLRQAGADCLSWRGVQAYR